MKYAHPLAFKNLNDEHIEKGAPRGVHSKLKDESKFYLAKRLSIITHKSNFCLVKDC